MIVVVMHPEGGVSVIGAMEPGIVRSKLLSSTSTNIRTSDALVRLHQQTVAVRVDTVGIGSDSGGLV